MKGNKQPILSICIPTWNRWYVIEKTINSVCTQPEFENWDIELIISDNASTDNTEQIIKNFQCKYKNIKYFRNSSNIWWMKNILKSYSLWTWKYLWCLWSDDFLAQWCLWYTLNVINSYSPTIIIHRNVISKKFNVLKNNFFYNNVLYKFPSQKSYFDFLWDQFNLDKNSFDTLESQITRISWYIISSEYFKISKNNVISEEWIDFFNTFSFIQTLLVHSINVSNPIILFNESYVWQDVNSDKNYQKKFKKSVDNIDKSFKFKVFYNDACYLSKCLNNKYHFNKNTIRFFKSFTNFRKLLYIANISFFSKIKSILPLEIRKKLWWFIAKYLSK